MTSKFIFFLADDAYDENDLLEVDPASFLDQSSSLQEGNDESQITNDSFASGSNQFDDSNSGFGPNFGDFGGGFGMGGAGPGVGQSNEIQFDPATNRVILGKTEKRENVLLSVCVMIQN